ncbi:MAG: hypothetical protein FWE03_05480 [Firmicutes bacterium]|nr:hypothetical protein [Bacillota bacterium]
MAIYNFFDHISFPDENQIKRIREMFFDTIVLRLDTKKFFDNNPPKIKVLNLRDYPKNLAAIVSKSNEDNLYSLLNIDYGNSIIPLDLAIYRTANYYLKIIQMDTYDEQKLIEKLFRIEAGTLTMHIYHALGIQAAVASKLCGITTYDTDGVLDLKKFLAQASKSGDNSLSAFASKINEIRNSNHWKEIYRIRKSIAHSISKLEDESTHIYISGHGLRSGDMNYIVNSKNLFENIENIKKCLYSLLEVKNKLQEIVDCVIVGYGIE